MGTTNPLTSHSLGHPLECSLRKQLAEARCTGGKRLPTVRELARQFGVSRSTAASVVSKLAREGLVSSVRRRGTFATGKRVARPRARTGAVALICEMPPDTLREPYYAGILDALSRAVGSVRNHLLLLNCRPGHRDEREHLRSVLREQRIDGAFYVISSHPSKHTLKMLRRWRVPTVMIDHGGGEYGVDSAVVDNAFGSQQVMRHLLNLGHRRIAFINAPGMTTSAIERYETYRSTLQDAGIPFDRQLTRRAEPWILGGMRAMNGLLRRYPTAVFAFNDPTAIGAIQAIEASGLSVPDDISVIGFGDMEPAYAAERQLTTVTIDIPGMAEAAVKRLMKRIEDPEAPPQKMLVKATLKTGDTTGVCAKASVRS